jgi:hypothetical protein
VLQDGGREPLPELQGGELTSPVERWITDARYFNTSTHVPLAASTDPHVAHLFFTQEVKAYLESIKNVGVHRSNIGPNDKAIDQQ